MYTCDTPSKNVYSITVISRYSASGSRATPCGMEDVDALGIKGPYRRDFERLYLGRAEK